MDIRPLRGCIEHARTDIDTAHSYIDVYEPIVAHKKFSCTNVLIIGIHKEGTISMWNEYFPHAKIYAIGTDTLARQWYKLRDPYITIMEKREIFNPAFVKEEFVDKGIKFDLILYDSNGNIDCYRWCLDLYLPLLCDHGILCLEDIPDLEWCEALSQCLPADLRENSSTHDLRSIRDTPDNILFIINKDPLLKSLKHIAEPGKPQD